MINKNNNIADVSLMKEDRLHFLLLRFISSFVIVLLLAFIILLIYQSLPAIKEFGLSFVTSSWWNPGEDEYGALAFIAGTVITSFIALSIAAPISIAIALFVTEILPKKIASVISLFIEMIAAVPSIIFGLWGIFYLAPFIQKQLAPFIEEHLGFISFFQGPSFGLGLLAASLILSIMIIPTITSIAREVFKTVPGLRKETALALGATKYEMIKIAILKPSFSGIMGAIILGLGRALGETMAVAMVIGNQPDIPKTIFSPSATLASVIANEYAEADSELHLSALCLVGLILFGVTLIINAGARAIVWNHQRKQK